MRRWGRGDLVVTTAQPCSLWTSPDSDGSLLVDVFSPGVMGIVLSDPRGTMAEVALSGGRRGWMVKTSLRRVNLGAWARGDKSSKTPEIY